jgi:hypothetical protein
MKRIMPHVGKLVFAGFMLGVVVFLLSLSWSALSKIFPDSFINQVFGLVNFDIAALAWLLGFIYVAKGFTQRSIALVMFIVSVVGTISLVSIEIALSTGWMAYAAVVVPLSILMTVMLAGHVVATYFFHLSAPDVASEIERQADMDGIYDQAQKDASAELDRLRPELAQELARGMVDSVRRDLGYVPVKGGDVLGSLQAAQSEPKREYPVQVEHVAPFIEESSVPNSKSPQA